MKKLSLVCLGFLVFGFGFSKSIIDTPNWSKPEEIAKSSDSLSTSFSLYKWNSSLLALGGDAGTYSIRIFSNDSGSWRTFPTADPNLTQVDIDPNQNRLLIARATLWSNRVEARFAVGSLSLDGGLAANNPAYLRLDQTQLFGSGNPYLRMLERDGFAQIGFSGGVIVEAEVRIPYVIAAVTVKGKVIGGDTAASGVFTSSDAGRTWRSELISVGYAETPVIARTKAFYYYCSKAGIGGEPYELWNSRCAVNGGSSWSHPETLNKSVARKLSENLHAIGEGDTVHLCWLDARNERTKLSLTRPRAENYEIAYCRRKDLDAGWSKDIILSKGLRWAYAPSMSVEGNNVVVAWAGAKSDKEGRNEWNASDIYYVVSKDGGSTWTKPARVTDGFKSGITSGRPQVALHKGVIHLFYVQGELNYQKVSAGMVKLNQPPWPILYQQRSFPN